MNKLSAAVAAALAVTGTASLAQDYQLEAGLSYDMADTNGFEDNTLTLNGVYHFGMVETKGRPLAEAAYLGRNSNAFAAYSTTDESEVDIIGLGVEYFAQDLYLRGAFAQQSNGFDATLLSARVGYFVNAGTGFFVGLENLDIDIPGADDLTNLEVGLKSVGMLGGGSAYNGELTLTQLDDADDTLQYTLEGDYYLNRMFSLGVSFEDSDADGSESEIGLRTRYFVTPLFSLGLEYTTQDETDTIGLNAAARF